jgi:hypothetical protein
MHAGMVLVVAVSITAAWFGPPGLSTAAWAAGPGDECGDCQPAWQVVETRNFRILSFGRAVDATTADSCEQMREALVRQWVDREDVAAWNPKCDLVLYPTEEAYLDEVGRGARQTVASALVDRKDGRVVQRRIDVRATRSDWQTAALAHELVHVVLADRFAAAALPRWLDEGMAILADPREKQRRHRHSLERAMARGAHFRLAELVALGDYPPAERWGAFYGQSASVVEYLVAQRGHARFAEFVELALARGYDQALRSVYGFRGLGELERRWQGQVFAPGGSASAEARPRPASEASETTSAG